MSIFSKSNHCVGIDIGFNTLKVVELSRTGKKISIIGSNMVGIPSASVNRNGFAHKDTIATAIKDALDKAQPKPIKSDNVITALPESLIFSKILNVPKEIPENKYEENVLLQISELLPWPIADTYFDWKLLPATFTKNKKDEQKIFVSASMKKLVDDLLEISHIAGLKIDAIETKPIAATRSLVGKNDKGSIIILDIGAEHSSASVIKNGNIEFSSTISVGANAITRRKDPSNITITDLKTLADPLVENTINNINYFNTRLHPGGKITEIRLCGGGSNLTGIDTVISQRTKIKTTKGDSSINFNNKLKYDPIALQIFTVAIGLGLRDLI